jgi:hypothetical protein
MHVIESARVNIVTDAIGDATVFITHGINRKLNGLLLSIRYYPGTIEAGADLTITGETSGIPILTVTNAGTGIVVYYPRALLNEVADGAIGARGMEIIPIHNERIKVVVAQGGNATAGWIEAILLTDSPY